MCSFPVGPRDELLIEARKRGFNFRVFLLLNLISKFRVWL